MENKIYTRIIYTHDLLSQCLITQSFLANGRIYRGVITYTNLLYIQELVDDKFGNVVGTYANNVAQCKIKMKRELKRIGVQFNDEVRSKVV